MIPAWFISALALLAAISLMRLVEMPKYTRISLVIPLFYFSGLYLWATTTALSTVTRTDFVRAGLVTLFIPIIINTLVVELRRGKK